MSEVQVFNHPEFGTVPCHVIDGDPWFVGREVAQALGYTNTRKALRDHVPAAHRRGNDSFPPSDLRELDPQTVLISEAGLYWLIIRSNMPKAVEFTDWVASELLPTVRKAQEVGIDVVKELKAKVEDLKAEKDMAEIEAASANEQLSYAFRLGWYASKTAPSVQRHGYDPYSGEIFTKVPSQLGRHSSI